MSFAAALRLPLVIGAALTDHPEKRPELTAIWRANADAFRAGEVTEREMLACLREAMPDDWAPTGEWADYLASLDG